MLQQTQVTRVAEFWPRFLARFPSVGALADASLGRRHGGVVGARVLPSREVLHAAAGVVVDDLDGRSGSTARHLRRLPGMGAYTSAAVASIGFGEAVPVVDANVVRAFSRGSSALKGDDPPGAGTVARSSRRRRRLLDRLAAGRLQPGGHGARCARLSPSTPAARHARSRVSAPRRQEVWIRSRPGPAASQRTVSLREAVAAIRTDAVLLLARQEHDRGWWEGLWTSRGRRSVRGDDPPAIARGRLVERLGVRVPAHGAPDRGGRTP